jgi:hypothetical protein
MANTETKNAFFDLSRRRARELAQLPSSRYVHGMGSRRGPRFYSRNKGFTDRQPPNCELSPLRKNYAQPSKGKYHRRGQTSINYEN